MFARNWPNILRQGFLFGFALGPFERSGNHNELFVFLENSSKTRVIYANVDRSSPNHKMMKYLPLSYPVNKIFSFFLSLERPQFPPFLFWVTNGVAQFSVGETSDLFPRAVRPVMGRVLYYARYFATSNQMGTSNHKRAGYLRILTIAWDAMVIPCCLGVINFRFAQWELVCWRVRNFIYR